MFLSRNYQLTVDVLKTILSLLSKAHFLNRYEGFKNIKFPRAGYQTDSSKTLSTLMSLLFTSKFSSDQFENHIELLSTFFDESHREPNAKSENKTDKQPLFVISIVYFLSPLFHRWVPSIWIFSLDGHYLNNRVFLSRNYRLIVAPRKFDVLKTNICPRSEASRANMLFLRTSRADSVSPRMNTIALCDQFRLLRISENLLVNSNGWSCTSTSANEIAVFA